MPQKNVVLVVLDGWGIGRHDESNPIHVAKLETFARLKETYPITSLHASGISVGLPWGEVGNSEVGHLTLGAGKVLYQYYPKILMAIQDKTFFTNPVLKSVCDHVKKTGGALNLAGLLSDGNVHASLEHVHALLDFATQEGVTNVNLHFFADGKDTPPHSLQKFLSQFPTDKLASLIGRYYAMDREGNYSLTETAYLTMTGSGGQLVSDPTALMNETYGRGDTEEYLPAMRFTDDKKIKDGDALFFFNYREDSIREIASSFIMPDFKEFKVLPFQNLFVATMTHYDDRFNVPVAFPADRVEEPIGKVFSDLGFSQLRVAETYKYAHVTYFFNGLREDPFPGEYRTLVPSATSLHVEEHPEMMAKAITDRVIEAIQSRAFPFVFVNYANADAIGHTANYNAGIEAVKIIDREVARLVAATEEADSILIITGDHGNVEEMVSPTTGLPESQHDPSPVPFHLVSKDYAGRHFVNADTYEGETLGSLADVAPTILELMGIEKPKEMTGESLLDKMK